MRGIFSSMKHNLLLIHSSITILLRLNHSFFLVLATMECMKQRDAECTAAGNADEGVLKIDNGVVADGTLGNGTLQDRSVANWNFFFYLTEALFIEVEESSNVDTNVARYVLKKKVSFVNAFG